MDRIMPSSDGGHHDEVEANAALPDTEHEVLPWLRRGLTLLPSERVQAARLL